MGTRSVSDVLDASAQLMGDVTNITWTRPELLRWLNDGLLQMAVQAPHTCAKIAEVSLVVNKAQQPLPADSLRLLTVFCEVGGGALTPVDRGVMNRENRKWMQAPPGELIHFMYEKETPNSFYVYPTARIGARVQLSYAAQYRVNGEGELLPVADAYITALTNYIAYRACSKNVEAAANPSAATNYYQVFLNALGVTTAE